MFKVPLGVFTLVFCLSLPLCGWAAEETHIFEFDYDNQIEAPVLNQEPAPSAIPMEVEQSIHIPPPPALTAQSDMSAEEAPTLDLLFMPVEADEAEATPEPAPVQTAPPAPAPVKTPETAEAKPAVAPAATPTGEEGKIQVSLSKPQTPAPQPRAAAPAKAQSAPRAVAAPAPFSARFVNDPRYRFWLLATKIWNLPLHERTRAASAAVPARAEVFDLKSFPKYTQAR